jgi:hypothetical protein
MQWACCRQGRILIYADWYKIGLNEVAIGMTMHYGGVELEQADWYQYFLSA